jgi:Zn-dependent peptidase ImmA (M78 family)
MFRRGFKTWAEQISARAREKLGIEAGGVLDLIRLAEMLGVSVLTPGELAELPTELRTRLETDHQECWSAITVTDGDNHLVVINPSHAASRRNSDLAHEVAHIILGHEPSLMFMTPNSGIAIRTHNEEQEEEATWLAGCLLLPRDALLLIRRLNLSDDDACSRYGISSAMLRFRLNVTGVNAQMQKRRNLRHS